jgi:hypothetical protein
MYAWWMPIPESYQPLVQMIAVPEVQGGSTWK